MVGITMHGGKSGTEIDEGPARSIQSNSGQIFLERSKVYMN